MIKNAVTYFEDWKERGGRRAAPSESPLIDVGGRVGGRPVETVLRAIRSLESQTAGRFRIVFVRYKPLDVSAMDASVVLPPPRPLCSPSTWLDALQLPEDARMRRNPRFLRVLQECSHPSKYTDKQKRQMLYAIKFGLACDPERAGYEGGKLPFTVPGFNPKEMTEGLADVSRPKISRSRLRGPGFMDHAY
jgi:hypothetical protein